MAEELEDEIQYELIALERLNAIPLFINFHVEVARQNAIWRRICRVFAARLALIRLKQGMQTA